MVGQPISAVNYVTRVIKECWKAIIKIGQGKPLDARQGLWFLRQFCILYGFAVTKLKNMTTLMLPQLLSITALPDLLPILSFNEDTIYTLEKYQKTSACFQIRHPTLIHRGISDKLGHRRNRTLLLPSPLSIQAAEESPTSTVTFERVVLMLMEYLTRAGSPTLSEELFGQLVENVPRGPSVNDALTFHEIHLCVDFLLNHNSPITPDRWFREGCDRQQLLLINQTGLKACNLPDLSPRLVAAHLKHVISSQGGLIPLEIVRAIMTLFPLDSHLTNPVQWQIEHSTIQALESLLTIPLFHFQLLKKVVSLAQHILDSSDHVTGQALAIVFPVIRFDTKLSIHEIKHWNLVWGFILEHAQLIFHRSELFSLVQPSHRIKAGYQYTLEVLSESGIKFLK